MTRKRHQEQHQEDEIMTDPNDNLTGDLLPDPPADDQQELAASLNQLERMAAAIEQENAVQDPEGGILAAPGEDPANLAGQVDGLISVTIGILAPAFPSLNQIYTPETRATLAGAVAPVMVKHGWNLGDVYGKYSEEITLAMVAIPLGMATYQGVKGDIDARKKAAKGEQPGQIQGEPNGG